MRLFFKAFHFGQILFNLVHTRVGASWKKLCFCIFKGLCWPPSLEKGITVLNFGSKSLYEPWGIVQFTINNIKLIYFSFMIWSEYEVIMSQCFCSFLINYYYIFFYISPLFNIQVLCKHQWNISWDFLQNHDIFTSEKITIAMVSE